MRVTKGRGEVGTRGRENIAWSIGTHPNSDRALRIGMKRKKKTTRGERTALGGKGHMKKKSA